jgi:hypothetical protein
MRRALVLKLVLLLISASACGGSDTAPAPTAPSFASAAGKWTGTFQASTGTNPPGVSTMFMLNGQTGATVFGNWSITGFGGANGMVSGTTTVNTFSGTLTYNARTLQGNVCTGTIPVSGSAGGNTMTWTSSGVVSSCTNLPFNITMALVLTP